MRSDVRVSFCLKPRGAVDRPPSHCGSTPYAIYHDILHCKHLHYHGLSVDYLAMISYVFN